MLFPGHVEAGHGSRHADRRSMGMVKVPIVLAVFQEHLGVCLCRSRFTEVVSDRLAAVGRSKDEKTAPAYVAGPGKRHRQGQGGRHRRVNGIAALLQHFHARLGCQHFLRRHHPSIGACRFGAGVG